MSIKLLSSLSYQEQENFTHGQVVVDPLTIQQNGLLQLNARDVNDSNNYSAQLVANYTDNSLHVVSNGVDALDVDASGNVSCNKALNVTGGNLTTSGDYSVSTNNVQFQPNATSGINFAIVSQGQNDPSLRVDRYYNGALQNWYFIQLNQQGTTTNRPASLIAQHIGTMYFDTTLGKPVWFNGSGWIDAMGNNV